MLVEAGRWHLRSTHRPMYQRSLQTHKCLVVPVKGCRVQSALGVVEIGTPKSLIACALQERVDFAKWGLVEMCLSLDCQEDKDALQRMTAHDLINLVIDLQFGTDPEKCRSLKEPYSQPKKRRGTLWRRMLSCAAYWRIWQWRMRSMGRT